MKKEYSRPTLVRKGRLSAQTAARVISGDSQAPE
ncbi:putative RiPP precursor [Mesorhizobium sp. M2C.T.Ca.TU.009.01.2.1]|nr:putative RiPP precursor [Mesorhizobium sp. M2C.T.Ca.TU.002.02.1.1]RUU61908.1 putative RiPP precursor [Mesorhizobium sp. M2C.T.Ca.TU.009.01.2.1]